MLKSEFLLDSDSLITSILDLARDRVHVKFNLLRDSVYASRFRW